MPAGTRAAPAGAPRAAARGGGHGTARGGSPAREARNRAARSCRQARWDQRPGLREEKGGRSQTPSRSAARPGRRGCGSEPLAPAAPRRRCGRASSGPLLPPAGRGADSPRPPAPPPLGAGTEGRRKGRREGAALPEQPG